MTGFLQQQDPLDLEITPGFTVRDLTSVDDCTSAIHKLEDDIINIRGQIANDEAQPGGRLPGWRGKAQNAISWKKRVMRAVRERAATFGEPPGRLQARRKAVLDEMRNQLGNAEFERIAALARQKQPHLWDEKVARETPAE